MKKASCLVRRRYYLFYARKNVCSRLESFARMAGISIRRFRRLEHGVDDPTEDELGKLAKALDMNLWHMKDRERRYRESRREAWRMERDRRLAEEGDAES